MTDQPRILIVDHDPDARYQVQGVVERAGFDACGQAGLGTEAVSLAVEQRPDLILCALREPLARVTLARKLAAITLRLWKKGERYDPAKLTQQAR